MSGSALPSADGSNRRPSWRRRWLRRGLWVLGSGLLLLLLVHLPPVKRLVGETLARALGSAVGGEVRFGRLDYSLWTGEVAVEGLELRAPRLEITCSRARADVGLGGVEVEVSGPRVVITQGPGAHGARPPSRPWAILRHLDTATLSDGALELRNGEGRPWLRLEGVEAQLGRKDGNPRGRARIAEAGVGWPAVGIRVEGVTAEAEVELESPSGTVRLLKGLVSSEEASLEGRGELRQIQPIVASADGGGTIDARLLNRLVPALRLEGRLGARGSFEKHGARARGSLDVELEDLRAFDIGPWSGSARASLEGRELSIDSLSLAGYDGRVEGEGSVFLGPGPASVDVRASGLDARALVATFVEAPPPLASSVDAEVRVEIQGWDPDTLTGEAQVGLRGQEDSGWPVDGPIRVALAERRVAFSTAGLAIRTAQATAEGTFSFSQDLEMRYGLSLPDLDGGRDLLSDAGVELPALALGGALQVQGEVEGRVPDWRATARVSSESISVEDVDLGLEGSLVATTLGVQIQSLTLEGVEGRAQVRGFVPLAADRAWEVEADVAELRLADALARHGVPVAATAGGVVRVSGPRVDPMAAFEIEARAEPAAGPEPPGDPGTPEQQEGEQRAGPQAATLRLVGQASARGVVVEELKAELGGGVAEASVAWTREGGTLEGRGQIADVQLARLPWLPPLAALETFDSTAAGELELSGRVDAPLGRLALRLRGTRYRDAELPDLDLEADLDGAEARMAGRLDGEPLLSGQLAFNEAWPLHLEVELGALPLTQVLRALPGARREQRLLTLAGRASVDVPLREPGQLGYEARVTDLQMDLGGGGSSAGSFEVSGSRDSLAVRGLELMAEGSHFRADGELGLASDASTPLVVRGSVPLADLAPFLPDTELEGEATVDLEITGRLAQPDLSGHLQLDGGAGHIGPVALEGLALEATAGGGVLTVDRAEGGVAGGRISARGDLPLQPREEPTTLEFRLEGVDPGTFFVADRGEPPLVAPLDMTGRVLVRAPAVEAIEAEGTITAWKVDAGAGALLLEKPAGWRFQEGSLALEDIRLRGSKGHLGVDGSWVPGGALQLRLGGEADLAFLNPVLGGNLRLSGPGRVDLTVSREGDRLVLEGGASLQEARAVLREPPVVISHLSGSLQARGRELVLEALGEVGDGSLRASGTVGIRAGGPEVDVTLEAQRVPLVYPEGLRTRSSGTLHLSGRERRYRLEGDVAVHRALYDRETDFENQSLDTVGAELKALDERGSVLERVQLDVRVRLEDGLRVQNRQLRVVADGAVTLGGDLLTPEVRGSVSLRDGGTVRLSRATLRLADGRIDLNGYPAIPPEVDISGRTQVTGVQIEVELTGPLDDLRTSLSSPNRSDLTQADLATLLLTGRTAQAAADASGAIVAEEVAAALGSALNDRLGGGVLIDVSRDESLIVQDTDPTQRFNIGIPLGKQLYVIYSQSLDRSGVRWILDFRPRGQYRVRLISDEVESSAIELSNSFDFDLWSRGGQDKAKPTEEPRVHEVRVEGLPEAEAGELAKKSQLDTGDRYDFFQAETSARKMEELLVDRGYRAAVVEPSDRKAGEGQVDLVFSVDRGPRIDVEWMGDDPGKKLRKRFGETWDAFLPLPETAARRARDLQHELQARRYYEAAVSAEVGEGEGEARVRFDVRRGPRGDGVDLHFEGNEVLSPESLAVVLPSTDTARFFAMIAPGGRTRLESALRTAGARAGLLELEVGEPREAWDPGARRLRVTIPIQEGELSDVVHLDLPEEALSLEGASPPRLALKVGEPFRIDDYVDDRSRLATWFRAEGFPDVRLAGILEPVPGGLAVRFEADTGERARVGAVRRAGDEHTRPGVVDNAMTLGPGDLVRPEEIARSRDHLSETRVFRSVDIRAETTADAGVRDLVVDLTDRPDLKVEYKIRYETGKSRETPEEGSPEGTRGFQFGAGIEAVNPLGWAHRYSLYGLAGKSRQLLGATFEAQTFFGRRWRTQAFLYDDNQADYDATSITKRIRGLALQQTKRWQSGLSGRRWHDRLRLRWGYGFARIDYLDPDTGGIVGGDRAGVIASLIGDTRDSVTDPHRGFLWTATADFALQALGSEVDYVKLYGQFFVYVPLGTRVVWAQGLRVGAVPGDNPLLLLDRRFKAGGATTVRGFAENTLGPQYEGIPLGGQATVVFNQELRFPLPLWERLYGGVFYDAGNVWGLSRGLDFSDLRHNVGAGLRVMFPFGPIRLDWAWVLDPLEGEQRSRWQFALGHAF